jgi:hypothetical protein
VKLRPYAVRCHVGSINVDYYVDARDEKHAIKEARRRAKANDQRVDSTRILSAWEAYT